MAIKTDAGYCQPITISSCNHRRKFLCWLRHSVVQCRRTMNGTDQLLPPPFAEQGLFTIHKAHIRRVNPDEETTDWRAVCGRTACTFRRTGRGLLPFRPLSSCHDTRSSKSTDIIENQGHSQNCVYWVLECPRIFQDADQPCSGTKGQ